MATTRAQGPLREEDIEHQTGDFWVHRDRARALYTVYRAGATHSTSDSSYQLTPDGRSLAVARANYLAKRAEQAVPRRLPNEALAQAAPMEPSPARRLERPRP